MAKRPTSPREKMMVRVLAAVLGLLVVIVGMRFIAGGDSGTTDSNVAGTTGAKSSKADAVPLGNHPKVPPLSFTGTDPFGPLVADVAPTTAPTTAPSPAPSPSASPTTPSEASVGGQTISLLDVFSDAGTNQAVVLVAPKVYTVKVGDTFATDYSVVSITAPCATFAWQDQTFDLCAPGGGT